MVRQTGSKLCIIVLAFTALVVAKPSPSVAPWSGNGSPAVSRSVGPSLPASGMGSITVPYKPKSSPLFPKFVDPADIIARKTEMLNNLFAGLGPVMPEALPKYNPGYGQSPLLLADNVVDDLPQPKQDNAVDEVIAQDKIKRGATKSGASKSSKFSPFSPFGPKVDPFAAKVNPFAPTVNPFAAKYNPFASMVNPFAAKVNPFAPKVNPFAPKVNPFAPKVNPFASIYSPFAPNFGSPAPVYPYSAFPAQQYAPGFYNSEASPARRRRSPEATVNDGSKMLGPPPAYPGLAPIAEEPETPESRLRKLYAAPKETLPGMFGPFGPFSPYAAVPMDPSMFIAKKPSFLDIYFKSLAATSAPDADVVDPDAPVTEIPIPKSTIVPPDFWVPSSIIPAPGEYAAKVTTFLDKLFSSLALNKTATTVDKTVLTRSIVEDPAKGKVLLTRSIEDVKNIAAAKDAIVDSIVSELGDLKTDMVQTLDDFIVYQKSLPVYGSSKKPSKVVSPFAAFFAPPTADPSIPFKQRMAVLSQVFDMLSGIQRNISLAIQEAIRSTTDAPINDEPQFWDVPTAMPDPNTAAISAFNATLLDVIRNRLMSLDKALGNGYDKPVGSPIYAAPVKRDVGDEEYGIPDYHENRGETDREQSKRSVQMQMHQGYQSMPPGTIESVQAGGGVVPGHQGGGIKLLESLDNGRDWKKWSEWAEFLNNQNEERKHHHNRH